MNEQLATILTGSTRLDDVVMRVGGEEFLVVLKKTLPEYLPIFADKILKKSRFPDAFWRRADPKNRDLPGVRLARGLPAD